VSRFAVRYLIAGIASGVTVGITALYLGIQHNTQGEFFNDVGELDLWYSFNVFISWFVLGVLAGVVIYSFAAGSKVLLRKMH
jgi:hypothetical protein